MESRSWIVSRWRQVKRGAMENSAPRKSDRRIEFLAVHQSEFRRQKMEIRARAGGRKIPNFGRAVRPVG
jgi:hypothetical protein